jgi:hypothetical protein
MVDYIPCRRGITHPYPSQEGIFRPYNFVLNATNSTPYPEDPTILYFRKPNFFNRERIAPGFR